MKLHNLTDTELATVLAALRYWQQDTPMDLSDYEHFDECDPLDSDEIDELCERLNCAYVIQIKESET